MWTSGGRSSGHTASPPAAAADVTPARHPTAPACDAAGLGPLAPSLPERTVMVARRNQAQTRDLQNLSRLFSRES